ncbi:MAG: YigZ family protein [Anaerolineae bacterium]|jgi:uncharacterized YigZ family protein
MASYEVPGAEARVEIRVSNSRFVATAAPVFSVEEARAFVARIRAEFADATHNVPVYLVGHGSSVVAHAHDDGEPSGTAGRPALAVLQGSGLGDVSVVVTRYFGGTKLGTGGLVRAYGDAVRAVLDVLPRARRVQTHVAQMTVPYSLYEPARGAIEAHDGLILDQDFAAEVTIAARFPVRAFDAFQAALQELSNGQVQAEIVERDQPALVPLGAAR